MKNKENYVNIKKFFQNIFKKFFQLVFIILHGKLKVNLTSENQKKFYNTKKIDDFYSNKKNYSTYEIKEGRIYTDNVFSVAVIKDQILLNDLSFRFENEKFLDLNKEKILKKGTPRKLKKIKGSVLSLIQGGSGNINYFHWLFDILPKLNIASKNYELEHIDYYFFPDLSQRNKKKFQFESLDALNLNINKCISSKNFHHIMADKLILVDHPSWVKGYTFFDFFENLPEWIIVWLREKFIYLSKNIKKEMPKKFYIDRSDSEANYSSYRKIINEDEVKSKLINCGFEIVKLSSFSFLEQIKLFNNADQIIGLHGAGFSNLTFSEQDTKVIELCSYQSPEVFAKIARLNKLKYVSIKSKPISHEIAKNLGHIKVSLEELDRNLNIK